MSATISLARRRSTSSSSRVEPASFRVAAGWYVDEPVPTTVTATYGGSSASTTITVIPARMTGIQGPGTIPGGFRLLAQLSFAGAAPFPVPVTFEASEPLLVELPDGVDPTSFYYPGIGIWTSWSFEVGTKQVSQPTPVTITARYRGTEESFTVTLEPIPAGKVVGQVVGLSTSGGGSVGLPFAEARIVGSSLVVSCGWPRVIHARHAYGGFLGQCRHAPGVDDRADWSLRALLFRPFRGCCGAFANGEGRRGCETRPLLSVPRRAPPSRCPGLGGAGHDRFLWNRYS